MIKLLWYNDIQASKKHIEKTIRSISRSIEGMEV